MGEDLKKQDALLVYFSKRARRWWLPQEEEIREQLPLSPSVTGEDGAIYQYGAED
jgi:hypothetical protein